MVVLEEPSGGSGVISQVKTLHFFEALVVHRSRKKVIGRRGNAPKFAKDPAKKDRFVGRPISSKNRSRATQGVKGLRLREDG